MSRQVPLADLLVTVEAETGPYQAAMVAARREAEQFSRTSTGITQTGAAMAAAGTKGAEGVNKISNAVVNLAGNAVGLQGPLGKLTEGLLLFAAGSTTVTAIAAGIAILGGAYQRLRTDIVNAQQAAADAQSEFATGALADAAARDPVGFARGQVEGAEFNLAAARRRLGSAQARRQPGTGVQLSGILNAKAEAEAAAEVERATFALESAKRLLTQAEEKAAKASKESGAAHADAAPKARAHAAATAQLADVSGAAIERLTELTGTTLDQGLLRFERELADVLAKVASADATGPWAELAGVLETIVDRLRTARSELDQVRSVTVPVLKTGLSERRLTGAERDGMLFDLKPQANEAERAARSVADLTRQIGQAARGALSLADAFADVSEETRRSLESVIQVAEAVPALVSGIRAGASGDIISGALGVLGGIAGVFSASPADQERQRAIEENTVALRELKQGLRGVLGGGASGDDFASASSFLQSLRANPTIRSAFEVGRSVSLSAGARARLQPAADALGITIPDSINEQWIRQFEEALAAAQIYPTTTGGRLTRFGDMSEILGLDPMQQIAAFQREFGRDLFGVRNDNALGRVLGSADLSTPEGRAALDAALKDLYTQFANLRPEEFSGFLGDMTPDQFRDAIRQVQGLLGQVPGLGGTTESFGINRSITEVTGSRIGSYLATANVFAERTAANTGALVQLMQQWLAAAGVSTLIPLGPDIATIDRQMADRASAARQTTGSLLIA